MSALPSTAEIHQGDGYVSLVPISAATTPLDYLFGLWFRLRDRSWLPVDCLISGVRSP
jgi:hypothetical protein